MSDDKFYKRLPIYRVLAAVVILITIAAGTIQQINYTRWGSDTIVFTHAARLMLRGQDIVNVPDHYGMFYVYPPLFAFLYIPLAFLPLEAVIVIWNIASAVLLGWSMTAFYSGMTGRPFFSLPQKTRWTVCFFTALLSARFTMFHLSVGQSSIVVLALAVLGLVSLSRHKLRSGIAIGLSIIIKILTVPFVFWFLARRNKKVLAGIVLGCLIGILLPALAVGIKKDFYYHQQWFDRVLLKNSAEDAESIGIGNLSIRAQLGRFFLGAPAFGYQGRYYDFTIVQLPPRLIVLIELLLMSMIALAIVLYAHRYRSSPSLVSQWGGFALVFSFVPSFSTWTEINHLVFLVPPYLYVTG
jgi:hypothetical protein